jgi:predicted nucleic acid-binding protein
LTIPLRAGDAGIAASYRNLLRNSRHFSLVSVNEAIAELASDLRARHNLKTPDAIHVASAIVSGCDTFITNDRMLSRVTEIRVMVLEDLTA